MMIYWEIFSKIIDDNPALTKNRSAWNDGWQEIEYYIVPTNYYQILVIEQARYKKTLVQ